MHPHSTLAVSLLESLAREEDALRAALAGVTAVNDALRRGDLAFALGAADEPLAEQLRVAAAARTATANGLARAVGLNGEPPTLSNLAARLDSPHSAELLAARERLTSLTAQIAAVQTRNANLITHLRSFFRGVLADLTPDSPARYGPSGSRLGPPAGAPPQTRA
ncbi:MAG: flagellar export chaperone FlgN [Gemmata sp.]